MKARKILLNSLFAFLLSFSLAIIIIATSKKAKAELVHKDYIFTLNYTCGSLNSYTYTSTVYMFKDLDENLLVFTPTRYGQGAYSGVVDSIGYQYFSFGYTKVNLYTGVDEFYLYIYGWNIARHEPQLLGYMPYSNHVGGNEDYDTYINGTAWWFNLSPAYPGIFPTGVWDIDEDQQKPYKFAALASSDNGFYCVEGFQLDGGGIRYSSNINNTDINTYQFFIDGIFTGNVTPGEQWNVGYNEGYRSGYDSGSQEGVSIGYEQGFNEGQTQGYDIGYNAGLNDENTAFNSYTNVLRTAWTGASDLLNTNILGRMKVIHFIAIPLLLGLFTLILKIIRG